MPGRFVVDGRLGKAGPVSGASSLRRRLSVAARPLLLGLAAVEGSACAMQPAESRLVTCSLENAETLPAELRDEAAVCGPIVDAARSAASDAGIDPGAVRVTVTAKSPYLIAATANVGGTALPEQKLGASDRPLNPRSIDMLARALAGQLAEFGASRR